MIFLLSAQLAFSAPETSKERFTRCTKDLIVNVIEGVGNDICQRAMKKVRKKGRKGYRVGETAACSALARYVVSTKGVPYADLVTAEMTSYFSQLFDPDLEFFKAQLVAYIEKITVITYHGYKYGECMSSERP